MYCKAVKKSARPECLHIHQKTSHDTGWAGFGEIVVLRSSNLPLALISPLFQGQLEAKTIWLLRVKTKMDEHVHTHAHV
jgi:hypothetical protein